MVSEEGAFRNLNPQNSAVISRVEKWAKYGWSCRIITAKDTSVAYGFTSLTNSVSSPRPSFATAKSISCFERGFLVFSK